MSRVIDLFAGIGGMRIAAENTGFSTVFSSEIDPITSNIYELNFAERPVGDITLISTESIPDHDLLMAGFPCQPFSSSGSRLGFEDTRGTLFFEIARILRAKSPEALLLENVKGLLTHDYGRTLRTVLQTLAELGYSTSHAVLNAKDFGLPQNRERTIIVGLKGRGREIDLIPPLPMFRPKLADFLDSVDSSAYIDPAEYTLLPDAMRTSQQSGLLFVGYMNKPIRKNGARPNTEHLSRVHRQHNRIYSASGVSPTLSSQESSGRNYVFDGIGVRRLTTAESFRIMGFPDGFKRVGSQTALRKAIGNSVPIPMIEFVVQRISDAQSHYLPTEFPSAKEVRKW